MEPALEHQRQDTGERQRDPDRLTSARRRPAAERQEQDREGGGERVEQRGVRGARPLHPDQEEPLVEGHREQAEEEDPRAVRPLDAPPRKQQARERPQGAGREQEPQER